MHFAFEMCLADQIRQKFIKFYFNVQGHPKPLLSVAIESACTTFYSNLGSIARTRFSNTATYYPIANFSYPLSFSALARDDSFRIYGKALRILKIVFQAADGEDLMILACTVFN